MMPAEHIGEPVQAGRVICLACSHAALPRSHSRRACARNKTVSKIAESWADALARGLTTVGSHWKILREFFELERLPTDYSETFDGNGWAATGFRYANFAPAWAVAVAKDSAHVKLRRKMLAYAIKHRMHEALAGALLLGGSDLVMEILGTRVFGKNGIPPYLVRGKESWVVPAKEKTK